MVTYTLAEIATRFARHDGIDADGLAHYEKSLRNLVQRHYLPPTIQQGRAFLYSRPAAVTIRLAQIASNFGIPRMSLDTLTRWLSDKHIAEAIERANSGESFGIHLIMTSSGTIFASADWADRKEIDKKSLTRAEKALAWIGEGPRAEVARFTLPASALIAETLHVLGES
ncbi:hypothetical protein ACIPCF_10020 [Paracoccus marcusii]|uniref:hypothetical protein n=1 Tax=Paracoccus marcusii TaxID=59779 RepID=UPI0038BC781E